MGPLRTTNKSDSQIKRMVIRWPPLKSNKRTWEGVNEEILDTFGEPVFCCSEGSTQGPPVISGVEYVAAVRDAEVGDGHYVILIRDESAIPEAINCTPAQAQDVLFDGGEVNGWELELQHVPHSIWNQVLRSFPELTTRGYTDPRYCNFTNEAHAFKFLFRI
jgi:hypothetical protein